MLSPFNVRGLDGELSDGLTEMQDEMKKENQCNCQDDPEPFPGMLHLDIRRSYPFPLCLLEALRALMPGLSHDDHLLHEGAEMPPLPFAGSVQPRERSRCTSSALPA